MKVNVQHSEINTRINSDVYSAITYNRIALVFMSYLKNKLNSNEKYTN